MSTSAAPPEAAGPGIDQPDGRVIFGHEQRTPNVYIEPRMPAWQRDRERAEAAQRAHCDHCAGIPDDVLAALRQALHGAREEGRRQP